MKKVFGYSLLVLTLLQVFPSISSAQVSILQPLYDTVLISGPVNNTLKESSEQIPEDKTLSPRITRTTSTFTRRESGKVLLTSTNFHDRGWYNDGVTGGKTTTSDTFRESDTTGIITVSTWKVDGVYKDTSEDVGKHYGAFSEGYLTEDNKKGSATCSSDTPSLKQNVTYTYNSSQKILLPADGVTYKPTDTYRVQMGVKVSSLKCNPKTWELDVIPLDSNRCPNITVAGVKTIGVPGAKNGPCIVTIEIKPGQAVDVTPEVKNEDLFEYVLVKEAVGRVENVRNPQPPEEPKGGRPTNPSKPRTPWHKIPVFGFISGGRSTIAADGAVTATNNTPAQDFKIILKSGPINNSFEEDLESTHIENKGTPQEEVIKRSFSGRFDFTQNESGKVSLNSASDQNRGKGIIETGDMSVETNNAGIVTKATRTINGIDTILSEYIGQPYGALSDGFPTDDNKKGSLTCVASEEGGKRTVKYVHNSSKKLIIPALSNRAQIYNVQGRVSVSPLKCNPETLGLEPSAAIPCKNITIVDGFGIRARSNSTECSFSINLYTGVEKDLTPQVSGVQLYEYNVTVDAVVDLTAPPEPVKPPKTTKTNTSLIGKFLDLVTGGSAVTTTNVAISNVTAQTGAPILVNNVVIGQPFTISLTVTATTSDLFINRIPTYALATSSTGFASPLSAQIPFNGVAANPITQPDPAGYFIIPAGSSRIFTYTGKFDYTKDPVGVKTFQINEVKYSYAASSYAWPHPITSGLTSAKVIATGGTDSSGGGTATTTTPTISVLTPRQGDSWLVGNKYRISWNAFKGAPLTYIYLSGGGNAEGFVKQIGSTQATATYLDYTVTTNDLPKIAGATWKVAVCSGIIVSGGKNCGWSGEVRVSQASSTVPIVTIRNTSGVVGQIVSGTTTQTMQVKFNFTVSAVGGKILVPHNALGNFILSPGIRPGLVSMTATPATDVEDKSWRGYVVRSGTSRNFTATYNIQNTGGISYASMQVGSLFYESFVTDNSFKQYIIKDGLSGLRVTFSFPPTVKTITATTTTTTTTTVEALTASCHGSYAEVGQPVYWQVTQTGGKAPFTYTWTESNGLSSSAYPLVRTYTTTGSKTMTVRVQSGTQSVTSTCSTYVMPATQTTQQSTPTQTPIESSTPSPSYTSSPSSTATPTATPTSESIPEESPTTPPEDPGESPSDSPSDSAFNSRRSPLANVFYALGDLLDTVWAW